MELRDYQKACLDAISRAFSSGINRQLVALPTGTGKTVIFAHLPEHMVLSKKMLVLAHREELLEQAREKLMVANPGFRVEIEQADRKADSGADVVVASVPSIGRSDSKRLQKINPGDFSLLVCDEAHHAVAPTYQNIFSYFGLPDNKDILLVGFTATPRRGDGIGLETVFDDIVYHRGIKDMVKEGWLCSITGYRIYSQTDLSGIHTRMGDFVQGELSETVNNSRRNLIVVKAYKERVSGKKALVFGVDVQHANELARVFRESLIPCEAITGEMDKDERHDIIESFRHGELKVLTNCQVLTEGFDQPDIETIIMARPTQSSLLYTQMIGRGTRIWEEKEKLVVIDIVDNSRKHSLVDLPTLFGLPPRFDLKGEDLIRAGEVIEDACEKYPGLDFEKITDLKSLRTQIEKIDFFDSVSLPTEVEQYSKLTWFKLPDGSYRISLGKGESGAIRENLLGQYEITFVVSGRAEQISFKPVHLSTTFAIADRYIENNKPEVIPYLFRRARWREEEATEKQLNTLWRLGISHPGNIRKGEASILISKFFAQR